MLTDSKTTVDDLKKIAAKFIDERNWRQHHSPKNLSMAIAAEAAELMEHFLWTSDSNEGLEKNRKEIEYELADITFALICFCEQYHVDLSRVFEEKMVLNAQKYPIEKSDANSDK